MVLPKMVKVLEQDVYRSFQISWTAIEDTPPAAYAELFWSVFQRTTSPLVAAVCASAKKQVVCDV